MRPGGFVVSLLLAASVWAQSSVQTMCSCPCPSAAPWVKVDGLTGTQFTYTPPPCKKVVKVCYKASTTCKDYTLTSACGASVVVTSQVFNGTGQRQALSHASFLLENCCEQPTATPTPPTPTATPTPEHPTPTPTATQTPEIPTPTPTVCVKRGCSAKCGSVFDCDEWLSCGTCPTPVPQPGKTPVPSCNCLFTKTLMIESFRESNEWHAEWFYFLDPKAVYQIVLEMHDDADYRIFTGKSKDPNSSLNRFIGPTLRGPRTVTMPWPYAGVPIREWDYLAFFGGAGRMTIWLENTNHISIVEETAIAVVNP